VPMLLVDTLPLRPAAIRCSSIDFKSCHA
jgi:hypothetical protein